ncbi:MAG: hypothetical protein V1934_08020 [Methanobacteriota archaeon]
MTPIEIYAFVVVLTIMVPLLMEIYYQQQYKMLLVSKLSASGGNLDHDELKQVMKIQPGIPGLYRIMLANSAIIILGMSLFYMFTEDVPAGSAQTINMVLSMLAGLIAAITGFYFGGRASESAMKTADDARNSGGAAGEKQAPVKTAPENPK